MKKLNLQLFALNTSTSIVDYLKSTGQDSSYSARSDLAKSLGISNYTGSASQNTQMLNALKNSSASNSTSKSSSSSSSSSKKSSSSSSTGSSIHGVDAETEAKMKSSFAPSSAYQQAMEYTNQLLEKVQSGKTSYTDKVQEMMDKIANRDAFSYDVDQDVLFQQALASAMSSGKTAMQDTIGQASALTGGYGSTYATSAGNQAYNAFVEDAYDNLPQYYQLAMNAYQMEGEEMYRQLGMYNDADVKEYERTYNAWSSSFQTAESMYEKEFNTWQAEVNNAFNYANLANSDYWNNANFEESVRQYNQNYAQAESQFNQQMSLKWAEYNTSVDQFNKNYELNQQKLAQTKYEFDETMKLKAAEAESGATLKTPSPTDLAKLLNLYNTNDPSFEATMDSYAVNEYNMDMIYDHLGNHGIQKEEEEEKKLKTPSWWNEYIWTK